MGRPREQSASARELSASAQEDTASERGAAIVEFAISSVILIFMVMGIVEGGLAFRAQLSLSNSVDEGARRGSIAGNTPNADWQILQQIRAHNVNPEAISDIVIFRAAARGEPVPAACRTASSASEFCNHYSAADLDRPESDFGSCGAVDGAWCPTTRDIDLRSGEFIGVWIAGNFASPTGALGSITLESQAILPFESRGY